MMRLDKLLCNLKYGSRKTIKTLAKAKKIVVDGVVVKDVSINVIPEKQTIFVNNQKVFYKEKIYLMMNKPAGYVSANSDQYHKTVFDLIKEPYSRFDLFCVGRLDIDTEGLLLLTNDGEFLHNMISPNKDVFKTYMVELKEDISEKGILQLQNGVMIKDGKGNEFKTKQAIVKIISSRVIQLSIKEGKFHQVKRMMLSIDNEVLYLKRIAMSSYVLREDLAVGEYEEILMN